MLARDGTIQQVNLAGANLLGVERGNLIERRLGLFISVESRLVFSAFLDKVFSTSKGKPSCKVMLEGDGFAPQWVQIEASLLDEQLEACRAIMVNINEQVQAEEALRKKRANLQLTLDATTDGICEWNFKTNDLFFSPRYYTMLGYDPGEFPATYETWKSLIHPDDLAGAIARRRGLLGKANRICYENEFRMRAKTGGYRWIRARSTVVERDEHGAAVRIIGNHEDITERKQAEQELQVSLEKYKVLFESFPLGITMTDKSGNILEANIEAERLLGIPQAEHTQRKYDSAEWQIVRPDGSFMPANEYASVQALRENRLIENVEMGIVKDKGNITWISVTAAPIPLEDYGVAITYGDITERKRAEEALRHSEEDLARNVETVPNGIIMVDSSAKITLANLPPRSSGTRICAVGTPGIHCYRGCILLSHSSRRSPAGAADHRGSHCHDRMRRVSSTASYFPTARREIVPGTLRGHLRKRLKMFVTVAHLLISPSASNL